MRISLFIVKNSLGEEVKTNDKEENSGIGISATLKRLDLIYHDKYFFENITKRFLPNKNKNHYYMKEFNCLIVDDEPN